MSRKVHYGFLLAFIMFFAVGVAYAQSDPGGSIRGTVYEDLNADGICVNTGEPTVQGIAIKFTAADGTRVINLESGDDGTYGLTAVGLGSWTVSAEPGTEWTVTSNKSIGVFLSVDQRLILGADFCVVRTGSTAPATPTPPPSAVLPESGAGIAPPLLAALVAGMGLIVTGVGMEWRRRRTD